MRSPTTAAIVAAATLLLAGATANAEPIQVRYVEGTLHGFLTLRSADGRLIASGDLLQTVAGDRVTTRLVFHFKDGSLSDETAVFSQHDHFTLITDKVVQRGPAFPRPLEMTIDVASGDVTVRYKNDHGEEKVESEHMDLPPDLANGLMPMLLKNLQPSAALPTVSLVAATPKPRLVKVEVTAGGIDTLSIGGSARKATHYVLKVDIGGVAGLVAPLVGKKPPDNHVWILQGDVPAFVKSRSTMFAGAPLWETALVSPQWPKAR